jgi:hypothetical protein
LGKTGKATQRLINTMPLGRYLFPFFKTPINSIKESGEYSPYGLFKGLAKGDIDAQARGLVGSSIAAAISSHTLQGHITGTHGGDSSEVTQSKADTAVAHIMRNVNDFPFLMQMSNLLQALEDPSGKKVSNFIDKQVASFVPAGVANIAEAADPTIRHPEGLALNVELRIPGQTSKVPRPRWTSRASRYNDRRMLSEPPTPSRLRLRKTIR